MFKATECNTMCTLLSLFVQLQYKHIVSSSTYNNWTITYYDAGDELLILKTTTIVDEEDEAEDEDSDGTML